jgi:hypothetical protein
MKKLVQLVLASVVGASMFVGVAAADTCTITNTGQASVNTCTSSESQVLTVTCNNDLNNILFAAVVSGGLLAAQLGTIAYRRLALK